MFIPLVPLVCGEGDVVQRSLQRERASGDERWVSRSIAKWWTPVSDCSNWHGETRIKSHCQSWKSERERWDGDSWTLTALRTGEILQPVNKLCQEGNLCFVILSYWIKPHKSPFTNLVLFLPYSEPCYTGAETREGRRNSTAIVSSLSSSPFAEVIYSLAGLHQEHYQALLDMREDQEHRFRTPRPDTGRRTTSCSGAGMVQKVRAGECHLPWPCPPTCGWTRWTRRMIWRPSSTSSRGPQRLVGGPRRTGQCASFRCFAGESLIAAQQLPVQNLLVCARSPLSLPLFYLFYLQACPSS